MFICAKFYVCMYVEEEDPVYQLSAYHLAFVKVQEILTETRNVLQYYVGERTRRVKKR